MKVLYLQNFHWSAEKLFLCAWHHSKQTRMLFVPAELTFLTNFTWLTFLRCKVCRTARFRQIHVYRAEQHRARQRDNFWHTCLCDWLSLELPDATLDSLNTSVTFCIVGTHGYVYCMYCMPAVEAGNCSPLSGEPWDRSGVLWCPTNWRWWSPLFAGLRLKKERQRTKQCNTSNSSAPHGIWSLHSDMGKKCSTEGCKQRKEGD